jgi:aromatic ring-opening dioxygenase LigB subunit
LRKWWFKAFWVHKGVKAMAATSPASEKRSPGKGLIAAALSPHPPIAVPEVGRGEERGARKTVESLTAMGRRLVEGQPETIVLITPHGPAFADAVSVRVHQRLYGDLSAFRAAEVSFDYETDMELVSTLKAVFAGDPVVFLDEGNLRRYRVSSDIDHGVMVPLYFLKKAGFTGKLVIVNIGFLPYLDLYALGHKIGSAVGESGKPVAVLASGDLSHRLIPGAPAGYSPRGREFDETLVRHLANFDVSSILTMDSALVEAAGECGLRPIMMLLGVLDEFEVVPQVLSY